MMQEAGERGDGLATTRTRDTNIREAGDIIPNGCWCGGWVKVRVGLEARDVAAMLEGKEGLGSDDDDE